MRQFFDAFKNPFRSFSDPRTVAVAAMLVALNVVLTRFLSIQTQFLRIDFGFLPVAICAMLYGPVTGALGAVLADVIGYLLYPTGPYFPGLTLSAFILGLIFGIFLYKKDLSVLRTAVCCLCAVLVVDFALNTVCLSILYEKAVALFVVPRLIKAAVMLPIETALIYLFYQVLGKRLAAQLKVKNAGRP